MKRCFCCYQLIEKGIEKDVAHSQCVKSIFGQTQLPYLDTLNTELESKAQLFLHKKIALTGVQKKLSLDFDTEQPNRLTVVGALGGRFILKPPTDEYPSLPELEDLSMHLAKIAGIPTAAHSLLPMSDGALAYVTRRFDRGDHGEKMHQEDACQLSEFLTEQKYKSSHEKLGKVIKRYSQFPGDDLLKLFEMTVFCFLIGNSDMHLKNFSIGRLRGYYRLTPAYDLVPTRLLISEQQDSEELALHLNGKKRNFKAADFLKYADNLAIPHRVVKSTLKTFEKKMPVFYQMIDMSFISDELKGNFKELLESRAARLLASS